MRLISIDRGNVTYVSSPHTFHPSSALSLSLSPSSSTFPRLSPSAALNLRYPSLSGIHYQFYWGQSRQTDRVQRWRQRSGGHDDVQTESEWIMPWRYSIPFRHRRCCRWRCRVAPLWPSIQVSVRLSFLQQSRRREWPNFVDEVQISCVNCAQRGRVLQEPEKFVDII